MTSRHKILFRAKIEKEHREKLREREKDELKCVVIDQTNQLSERLERFEIAMKATIEQQMEER